MPTTFTSLRVSAAAYIGGALTVIGTMALTGALTGTTAEFTTSASGTSLYANGGSVTLGASGLRSTTAIEVDTLSGTLIAARTLSGAALTLSRGATSGSVLCFRTTGAIGKCAAAPLASGLCTCNP